MKYTIYADVLCTGNLVNKETYEELKQLAPNVHVVKGSYDDENYPDSKVSCFHYAIYVKINIS
jgi:predicted phosphodiesterase